ncbi:DUF2690 domain-containing protein [Streptomyces sp. NPDC046881]|uniref:helix-turn-helix domain-containing protein n=1 Tax=Streptomyces sp. NPDC046881 TaxID=3155374 RepID=UPI0033D2B984
MPRWNALPEDLEPQIKEFTGRLRRLVDDSGLSIAALADRTGYGKTSWERYLGGRLLAPKGAVIALAEATGTDPGHLTTLWEVAERTWTRAELRHDRTLTAARITEARAALGDLVTTPEPAGSAAAGSAGGPQESPAGGAAAERVGGASAKAAGRAAGGPLGGAQAGAAGRAVGGASAGATGGAAAGPAGGAAGGTSLTLAKGGGGGAAGAPPAVPAQPADSDAGIQDSVPPGWVAGRSATASGAGIGSRTDSDGAGQPPKNSWGLAGYRGPSKATARPGMRPPTGPAEPVCADARTPAGTVRTPGPATPAPGPPAPGATGPGEAPAASAAARRSARRQQVAMFFAGLVGVGALIAGILYVTHGDGAGRKSEGGRSPSPSASARPSPPPGVKCAGAACTGKDAEAMGCSGELVTTAKTAAVGTTTLEVRYSKACGTAWGRITGGAPGDTVRVSVGKARQTGDITAAGDTIGYTPMIAVRNPAQARACATLATGQTGCTE